mgnify:FL=1|tara:strand:- start:240 stop:554 length:315 start_codon:yes stop_codon:yes gene_type:complete
MKKLQKGSIYERFDEDGDGTVTDEELSHAREMMELELREEKAHAQKNLAHIAMASMVGFALLPLLPFVSETRLATLASLSDMLFLSQASIVGMYFGASAYMSKK